MRTLIEQAEAVKNAAPALANLSGDKRNKILSELDSELRSRASVIIDANNKDVANGKESGLSAALIDRLAIDKNRLEKIAESVESLALLPDPLGEIFESWTRPNGLRIEKIRVPLGVLGIIYEARPNVTIDAAAICLKTGNAALLRGSSSALHTNRALVDAVQSVLKRCDLSPYSVDLVAESGRAAVLEFVQLKKHLDAVIPRGGAELINFVTENSSIPVLETGVGNCHVYIDSSAQRDKAISITINAKASRPSVCNAAETVLVHAKWAEKFLPDLISALREAGVTCRGCGRVVELVPGIEPASEKDWETEFLDYIIAVKIVDSIDQALKHISKFGTKHSESIITEDSKNAARFMNELDAAVIYHNASTRFTDGGEFGFGAEIGISTQKLHARGPMGLKELTTYKYLVHGDGQVR